jgi:hypothetical protein
MPIVPERRTTGMMGVSGRKPLGSNREKNERELMGGEIGPTAKAGKYRGSA